jgi:autotransporter-associated beta strand protein
MNRNDRDVGKLPFELIRASRFEDVQLGNMRRQVMNRPTRRCGRPRLTPLCASLLMLGIGAVSSPGLAQTISLTSASPSYDVGSSTYSIVGLTVADNVNGVITGAGGTLDYTGASAPFVLGGTTGGAPQNLNMSGLSNFVFDNPTQSFSVGGRFGGTGNSSTTSATLTLAANSIITASSFNVGTSPNSAANAVLNSGTVNLGASTTINADTINVGTSVKSSGTLTLAAGGTLVLRGTDGSSPVANWTIGANGQSSLQPTTGNVNLSGGSIDAEVTNLLIGQTGPSGSQATSGTLTLGSGTLDVTSIVLGQSTTTSTANATGTLTIGGTLVNAQTVTLGNHLDASGTINGIVNLNGGGTLLAQTIQGGAGTATRTFNWNGGTLGNYAPGDDLTVSIPTIALASGGGQIFDIEGTGATATVSSVLSGAGGFTKTGAGLLALTGTNTYTGGTTVTGGLVNFSTLSNLGTGDITLNGGGLQWATGSTVDVSTQLNPLGPNGATFDTNGNNVTLAGNLTGTNGVLIKQGDGILTLTGADTYSGGTQINTGTLQVGAGGTLGSIQGDVVDNAALAFNLSTTTTFGGVISGAGTVAQLGSGTTIFTGDNTYTGATTISAGTLQLGNGSTSGSIVSNVVDNGTLSIDRSDTVTLPSVISGSGSLRQAGTGTTILTADNTYTGATTITAGTLQLGNGGVSGSVAGNVVDLGTLAFDRSDTSTYAGQISGSGTLNQIGSGTTILTGDNTYTGATTISAGTLQLGNGGTTGSVANASAIVDNGALAIDHSNNVYFVSGITGTGALNQLGTGTTVLQATNTYAGGTTISAGTLQLGNGGTSGSIVGDVVDNGTLAFNRANATTFDGAISGTGAVTTLGSGPTILTADNTYTGGTTITAGSGTLQLGDGNTTGSIVGDVLDNGVLAVDRSDTVTLPGVISGSGLLSQAGTGTTILTGDNTYTGGTTISAGTLQLGNGGTTGSVVSNITDSGTLAFNRSDDIVYSNIISGTGGLNQLGPGTLQLEGAQTYTGPTNVLAGVLAVDGSIQSDTTTIAPGATLSGFGDLFGDVINQGTVWPGNAIVGDTNYGTLTIHGNYTGQGGVLELNTYLGGDGSPSDVLAIDGGAATGTTGVIIHNTAAGGAETSGNGILVVSAINGATTAADAFNLIGETRSGALDYRLFRGSVDGTSADSWYLRNDFIVPPEPPEPPEPPQPPEPPLPPDPPPEPLPPGVYPIIGPEVATYGVVQPIARELGLLTLGTMDQRIGDSALMASSTPPPIRDRLRGVVCSRRISITRIARLLHHRRTAIFTVSRRAQMFGRANCLKVTPIGLAATSRMVRRISACAAW